MTPPDNARAYTVLVVDDDALIALATTDSLHDLGHRAVMALSGAKALELLRGGLAVDLVLTDQAMPGMTGVQLARAIRTEWPGLRVLVSTGHTDIPADGGYDLPRLDKPYDQIALGAAIRKLMDGA
ncbi:MAG: response regulator [Rhodospirillales bacterium]